MDWQISLLFYSAKAGIEDQRENNRGTDKDLEGVVL